MSRFSQGNTKASKLTGVQVMEIREKAAARTHTQVELSVEYQVSIGTIRNIIYGVTWQKLPVVQPEAQIETEAKLSERLFNELAKLDPIKLEEKAEDAPAIDPYEQYLSRGRNERDTKSGEAGDQADVEHEEKGSAAGTPAGPITSEGGSK